MLTVWLFLNVPVAVSCCCCPVNTEGFVGLIEIVERPDKEPDPDRLAVCGLVFALSVMVRVPVLAPSAVGVNVIETVQLDPAANVFGDRGQFEVCAKSPETEIPEVVNAPDWLFCTVIVLAALVVVTVWPEKERLLGDRTTESMPEPANGTVCGLFCASSFTVSAPDLLPVAVGVNVTETVQLALAARLLGGEGQLEV